MYILEYVKEPKKHLYYYDHTENMIMCTTAISRALKFFDREIALLNAEKLKRIFDLDFSILSINKEDFNG